MTVVRLIKEWDGPDALQQTPGGTGVWEDVRFTFDPVAEFDYFVCRGWRRFAIRWRLRATATPITRAIRFADCFLAWTMPICYGCARITDYFPAESMIRIDFKADDVVEQIQAALAEDPWPQRLDALAYTRELALNR